MIGIPVIHYKQALRSDDSICKITGADPGFQVREGAFKKIVPS